MKYLLLFVLIMGCASVPKDLPYRKSYMEGCVDGALSSVPKDCEQCLYDMINDCQDKAEKFQYKSPADESRKN